MSVSLQGDPVLFPCAIAIALRCSGLIICSGVCFYVHAFSRSSRLSLAHMKWRTNAGCPIFNDHSGGFNQQAFVVIESVVCGTPQWKFDWYIHALLRSLHHPWNHGSCKYQSQRSWQRVLGEMAGLIERQAATRHAGPLQASE